VWWQYIIIAAVILFGIYGFLTLTKFETRVLSRRNTRRAADLYPNYADSLRKQRRNAKEDGGERTSDDGDHSREPKAPSRTNTARPPLADPPTVRPSLRNMPLGDHHTGSVTSRVPTPAPSSPPCTAAVLPRVASHGQSAVWRLPEARGRSRLASLARLRQAITPRAPPSRGRGSALTLTTGLGGANAVQEAVAG
jgi:hypothetical protein